MTFSLIAADPPWCPRDSLPGRTRGAAKNYTVMPTADICRLALPPIAKNAVLLMWRLASMPQDALDVVKAWGFVVVDGERVLTGPGKPLRYAPTALFMCQRCHKEDACVVEQVVTRRYDGHAARWLYWMCAPEGTPMWTLCEQCEGKRVAA